MGGMGSTRVFGASGGVEVVGLRRRPGRDVYHWLVTGPWTRLLVVYALAVLAAHHSLPFYVAAPWSTVDLETETGAAIPIEERPSDEVVSIAGQRIAPAGVPARYPAFDVTPAALVTAIVTERGVVRAPLDAGLRAMGR